MESKRKNVYITIFVITTIVAACIAVYFAIKSSTDTKNFEEKLNELNAKVEGTTENNVSEESNKETNIQEEVNEDNETQETVVEKVVERYIMPEIKQDECVNGYGDTIYNVYRNASFSGFNATLKSPNLVEISYTPKTLAAYYTWLELGDSMTNEKASIAFSNNKVVNVYIVGQGQSVGGENLFFLMEDGTVEYMPLAYAIKNNKFNSYGKVEGVTSIVDIVGGNVNGKAGGGHFSSFAIRNDGSFYDMGSILSKLDYYNIY